MIIKSQYRSTVNTALKGIKNNDIRAQKKQVRHIPQNNLQKCKNPVQRGLCERSEAESRTNDVLKSVQ